MNPVPSSPPPKIDVVLERLETLQVGQRDMATNLSNISCNLQNFQLTYTKAHEQLVSSTEQALKRLDKADEAMEELVNADDKLEKASIETNNAVTLHTQRLDLAEKNILTLQDELLKLTKNIQPLIFVNRIFVWIGIALGGSVLALIWAILTHAVEIIKH